MNKSNKQQKNSYKIKKIKNSFKKLDKLKNNIKTKALLIPWLRQKNKINLKMNNVDVVYFQATHQKIINMIPNLIKILIKQLISIINITKKKSTTIIIIKLKTNYLIIINILLLAIVIVMKKLQL